MVFVSSCGLQGDVEISMNVGLNIGLQSEFKSHVLLTPVQRWLHGALLYLKQDRQIPEEADVSHKTNTD